MFPVHFTTDTWAALPMIVSGRESRANCAERRPNPRDSRIPLQPPSSAHIGIIDFVAPAAAVGRRTGVLAPLRRRGPCQASGSARRGGPTPRTTFAGRRNSSRRRQARAAHASAGPQRSASRSEPTWRPHCGLCAGRSSATPKAATTAAWRVTINRNYDRDLGYHPTELTSKVVR